MPAGDLEAVARRAARGDGAAFEALCRGLQDDVWRYCRALTGDRELAFDAAQETFLRGVTAIRRFRGDAPVRVWMLVLARRAASRVLRDAARAPTAGDDPDTVGDGDAIGDAAGRVDLERLVADLPAGLRQAFVLTQLLGLPYEEAARVAGCPVGTIRSRVYRSRTRLIAALSGEDEVEEGSDDG